MQEDQKTFSEKNWPEKIQAFFSDKRNRNKTLAFLVAFILAFFISVLVSPPMDFPSGKIVTVGEGESLEQITKELKSVAFADGVQNRAVVRADYFAFCI
jgi:hypothetical protein